MNGKHPDNKRPDRTAKAWSSPHLRGRSSECQTLVDTAPADPSTRLNEWAYTYRARILGGPAPEIFQLARPGRHGHVSDRRARDMTHSRSSWKRNDLWTSPASRAGEGLQVRGPNEAAATYAALFPD